MPVSGGKSNFVIYFFLKIQLFLLKDANLKCVESDYRIFNPTQFPSILDLNETFAKLFSYIEVGFIYSDLFLLVKFGDIFFKYRQAWREFQAGGYVLRV